MFRQDFYCHCRCDLILACHFRLHTSPHSHCTSSTRRLHLEVSFSQPLSSATLHSWQQPDPSKERVISPVTILRPHAAAVYPHFGRASTQLCNQNRAPRSIRLVELVFFFQFLFKFPARNPSSMSVSTLKSPSQFPFRAVPW